jgi:hypothetical protein
LELGKLIEKENAVMRKAYFARRARMPEWSATKPHRKWRATILE